MRTVLVVDDEYDITEVMGTVLSSRGYLVATAHNGKVALEALAGQRPDLILLDVMMPEMTGIELLRRLKATDEHRDIPVLMMSAVADGGLSADDAALAGGCLRKPFTLDELMDALANVGFA